MLVNITREHYVQAECHSLNTCVMALALHETTGDPMWEVSGDFVIHKAKDVYRTTPAWFDEIAREADFLNIEPTEYVSLGHFEFNSETGEVGEFTWMDTCDLAPILEERLALERKSILMKRLMAGQCKSGMSNSSFPVLE